MLSAGKSAGSRKSRLVLFFLLIDGEVALRLFSQSNICAVPTFSTLQMLAIYTSSFPGFQVVTLSKSTVEVNNRTGNKDLWTVSCFRLVIVRLHRDNLVSKVLCYSFLQGRVEGPWEQSWNWVDFVPNWLIWSRHLLLGRLVRSCGSGGN